MKNLMKDTQKMNVSDQNYDGWNDTYMRNTVMPDIYNSIPSEVRSIIKEVNTYANMGSGNPSPSIGKLSKDKVFLPGLTEVGDRTDQNKTETNQKRFPIFTNNNSRIKKLSNGSGNAADWWNRSPRYDGYTYFWFIDNEGAISDYHDFAASYHNGVCFCFNV